MKDINDKKVSKIYNDNNNILEELLSLLNNTNKTNKECNNLEISGKCVFEIFYILIVFCKFNEVKDILVSLFNYKFLKENKIKKIYEYVCFI